MICVAKLYLTLYFFQIQRTYCSLYSSAGSNIHKHGCLNRSVNRTQFTTSCITLFFYQLKQMYFSFLFCHNQTASLILRLQTTKAFRFCQIAGFSLQSRFGQMSETVCNRSVGRTLLLFRI